MGCPALGQRPPRITSWTLLIHSEDVLEKDSEALRPGIRPALEELALSFFRSLDAREVFLTDEVTDGAPWEALMQGSASSAFSMAVLREDSPFLLRGISDDFESVPIRSGILLRSVGA